MAHLVVAYPTLAQEDFDWIQGFRRKHDPRDFSIVKPHFTLVFAIEEIPRAVFLEETRLQTKGVRRFEIELKVATVSRDHSGSYYHEFLVPEMGYSSLIKLHDRLYSGRFADHLRLDVDFIPHIGIGKSDEPLGPKQRIGELNARGLFIAGVVKALDVVDYGDGIVTTIEQFQLE